MEKNRFKTVIDTSQHHYNILPLKRNSLQADLNE